MENYWNPDSSPAGKHLDLNIDWPGSVVGSSAGCHPGNC